MSIQEMFEGYETIEFASVALTEEDLANKKIYLFAAPAEFNPQQLQGVTLDLKTEDDQEFPLDEVESIVVSKQDKETQKYLKKQILPLFPIKKTSSLLINKKLSGCYRIFKKISFPGISKKAIRKTKPVNNIEEKDEIIK